MLRTGPVGGAADRTGQGSAAGGAGKTAGMGTEPLGAAGDGHRGCGRDERCGAWEHGAEHGLRYGRRTADAQGRRATHWSVPQEAQGNVGCWIGLRGVHRRLQPSATTITLGGRKTAVGCRIGTHTLGLVGPARHGPPQHGPDQRPHPAPVAQSVAGRSLKMTPVRVRIPPGAPPRLRHFAAPLRSEAPVLAPFLVPFFALECLVRFDRALGAGPLA